MIIEVLNSDTCLRISCSSTDYGFPPCLTKQGRECRVPCRSHEMLLCTKWAYTAQKTTEAIYCFIDIMGGSPNKCGTDRCELDNDRECLEGKAPSPIGQGARPVGRHWRHQLLNLLLVVLVEKGNVQLIDWLCLVRSNCVYTVQNNIRSGVRGI